MAFDVADKDSQIELILRELNPDDNVNKALSLGHEDFVPLKMFLKRHAKSYHSKNMAKTYVLVSADNKIILGYITLVCSQINLTKDDSPDDIAEYPYTEYPSIKIVRLAIDTSICGRGWGGELINWSIAVSKERIMPFVGCRFLVVDSKPSAIAFYQKKGFTILDTEENKESAHPLLFIDLSKIQA